MPDILRNKRKCKLMPGIDKVTGDLKAYDLQNTFIAGTKEDTDDILNSLLCHLVMFNRPENLSVEYYSYCNGLNIWGGRNTSVPYFRNQIYANNIDAVWDRLERILMFCYKGFNSDELDYYSKSNLVIILNELDELLGADKIIAERRINLLKAVVACGEVIGLTLIVVSNKDDKVYDSFLPFFTLRLSKSLSAEWSANIFGYDIAKEYDKYAKNIWVMCNKKHLTIDKLRMNYYHETFLKELNKVFGLTFPEVYWDDINEQKSFDEMSHTYVHLILKRLFKTSVDTSQLTTQQMLDIFIYASSHISDVRCGCLSYDNIKSIILDDM